MANRTAIICGVTGGIGQVVAKKMIAEKVEVCGIYNNQNKAKELEAILGADSLFLYLMDLADTESVKIGFKKLLSEHPQINAVVFSVSHPIEYKPIMESTWQDYTKHFNLQLRGIFNVVQSLSEQIKSGQGIKFIILLTEACFGKPPAGMSHYVSAKYALMGMAKSMAVELAKYNCTVNFISPGMVQTDLINNFPAKLVEMQAANNPLKRIATPEDVAKVALFLAQEDSGYLNGVNITVNGGQVML